MDTTPKKLCIGLDYGVMVTSAANMGTTFCEEIPVMSSFISRPCIYRPRSYLDQFRLINSFSPYSTYINDAIEENAKLKRRDELIKLTQKYPNRSDYKLELSRLQKEVKGSIGKSKKKRK